MTARKKSTMVFCILTAAFLAAGAAWAQQYTPPTGFPDTALLDRAQAGDAQAQADAGKIYREGRKGFPVDYFEAYNWFSKAAQQGNAEAMYQIGNMYANGEIGPMELKYTSRDPSVRLTSDINYAKVLSWYMKAAELNYAPALYAIGSYYEATSRNFKEVKPNYPESVKYYQRAAENGSGRAMVELFEIYQWGDRHTKKNKNEAKKWYDKAIARTDPETIFFLGSKLNSNGNSKQRKEGMGLMTKAAEHGYAEAMYHLGLMKYQQPTFAYERYNAARFDKQKDAMIWFDKAAQNGDWRIQLRIADLLVWTVEISKKGGFYDTPFYQSEEAKPYQEQAAKFFRMAAENGNAVTQYIAAKQLYAGIGAEEDKAGAFKYFYKAVMEGSTMFTPFNHIPQDKAAGEEVYASPDGVVIIDNKNEDCFWYINARQFVGYMYNNGVGVPKNETEGAKWFTQFAPNEQESRHLNKAVRAAVRVLMLDMERKLIDDWNARWRQINPL